MVGKCLIHGVVVNVIEVTDRCTKEKYRFCGYCVEELLLRTIRGASYKIPSTADGDYSMSYHA